MDDTDEEESAVTAKNDEPAAAKVSRKKSAFNRITDMITKSPILEPLRSSNKPHKFHRLFFLGFCIPCT